jgi:hypothetical protein
MQDDCDWIKVFKNLIEKTLNFVFLQKSKTTIRWVSTARTSYESQNKRRTKLNDLDWLLQFFWQFTSTFPYGSLLIQYHIKIVLPLFQNDCLLFLKYLFQNDCPILILSVILLVCVILEERPLFDLSSKK